MPAIQALNRFFTEKSGFASAERTTKRSLGHKNRSTSAILFVFVSCERVLCPLSARKSCRKFEFATQNCDLGRRLRPISASWARPGREIALFFVPDHYFVSLANYLLGTKSAKLRQILCFVRKIALFVPQQRIQSELYVVEFHILVPAQVKEQEIEEIYGRDISVESGLQTVYTYAYEKKGEYMRAIHSLF